MSSSGRLAVALRQSGTCGTWAAHATTLASCVDEIRASKRRVVIRDRLGNIGGALW